jgi:hypothetical protein
MATKSTRLKRYLVTTRRALVTKVFMSHFRIKILNLFEPSTTLVRIIFNLHLINSTWVDLIIILYFILKKFIHFGICDMRQSWYDDCFIAETTTWLVIEKFVRRTKRKAFLSVNLLHMVGILSLVLFVQSYLIWIAIISMFKRS